MSQHAEGSAPARPKRDVELGIFLVGLVGLMVELLHTRMLSFFLGSISNFLAIPVALFGLALGSLLVHRERKGDVRRSSAILQALVLPVLTAAFVGFFAVANAFFPVIHVSLENPYGDAARMLAYSASSCRRTRSWVRYWPCISTGARRTSGGCTASISRVRRRAASSRPSC